MACAVTDDAHTVAEICELSKAFQIFVDNDNIVAFLGKPVYKGIADFAGTYNDDLQSSFSHKSNPK